MLSYIVVQFGYPALFLGAILEGEAILIIAGFFARLGLLNLPWVIAVALVGTIISDTFFFYLGRRHGREFLEKRPKWQAKFIKVQRLLEYHQNWLLFGFRFLYQMRAMIPFLIGTTRVSTKKFLLFNLAGAISWSFIFAYGGYFFGQAFAGWITDIKNHELEVLIVVALVIVIIWVVSRLLKKVFTI